MVSKKDKNESIDNFAHIFTLLVKTVRPQINADETVDIVKDFLTMISEGEGIAPEDAIYYGHAILATMPAVSKYKN